MKNVKVKEARGLITPYPSLIGANAPAVQAAEAILRDPKTRAIHVVDRDQKLLGTVDIRMILKHFLPHMFDVDILGTEVLEILYEQKAKDLIADGPIFVTEEHDLESAMRILIANDLDEIPVVDEDKRVIGELNVLEILSVWLIKTQG